MAPDNQRVYEDQNGEAFTWGDERVVGYPSGLQISIDATPFVTTGRAIEEHLPGTYKPRTWVAVSPLTSNGHRLQPRLIDERGIRGLRERAERARLEERK